MSESLIRTIFIVFFIVSLFLQFYLSIRQSRAVDAHKDKVPELFVSKITLEEHKKAALYTLAKQKLLRIDLIFQAGLLLLFTFGGGLNVLLGMVKSIGATELNQGVLLIVSFMLVNYLLSLPFSIYKTFYLEERFDFNRSTPKIFISDQIKGLILGGVLGIPLLYVVLYLMKISGANWWIYVWLVWLVFSLAMLWIFPKWIAPIFNKFKPLDNPSLQNRIEQLLNRTGFKSQGLFIMDGSKRSGHGNAYFTGFGKNKRIVFFDTLIENLTEPEIEAVLAHELGHFYHKHIIMQMIISFLSGLLILWILSLLLPNANFYRGLGVDVEPSNAMALILFFLVLPVFSIIFTPISSMFSRRNEYQADAFCAKHSDANQLISALIKLFRDNAGTLVNDSIHSMFYDSHPNALDRINALKKNML